MARVKGWIVSACWFLAAVFCAFAVLVELALAPARAHEWYPHECCSGQDCYPTGDGQKEPDPRASPHGWVLHDGTIIPYHEARPSPDGRFHVCRYLGDANAPLIRVGKPCLWVPQGGV